MASESRSNITLSASPFLLISSSTPIFASLLLAAGLLALFIFFARRKAGSRGNAVILLGPTDSGKTAILTTLVFQRTMPTHTSLQTNSSTYLNTSTMRSLRILDVPGHPRIREQFREHLSDAKAVIFVVDASTVSRNGPAVAEHLHLILHALTSLPPTQSNPALLILAHKCDLLTNSLSSTSTSEQIAITRVRTVLERELAKRRASQAGGVGVESLGAEGEGSDMGGLECSGNPTSFKFADWEGGEVAFLGSFVAVGEVTEVGSDEKTGSDGLATLREWLEELH